MSKKLKWGIAGAVVVGVGAFFAITAARKGEKPTEVRIEAVDSRDLVAVVTASGQVQPRTKVDVAADITGTHRQAGGEGRPDGEARRLPARDRSRAVRSGRAARRSRPFVGQGAGGAGARELPAGEAQL